LRSRNSHCTELSAVDVFIFCSYHNAQDSTSPTVPPRYDFRLDDLRSFHLVRTNCHACAHEAIVPNITLLQGRLDYTRLISLERQLRCGKCGTKGNASLDVEFRPRD
jgi:hypothetical protein